jgi:replicative DNA helicase
VKDYADPLAERAVLAAVFLAGDADPVRIVALTAEAYARLAATVTAGDFSDARHAAVWTAMGHVVAAGRGVEALTVNAALRAHRLDASATSEFVAHLTVASSAADNAEAHAAIVAAHGARRRAIVAAEAHRIRLLEGADIAASVSALENDSRDGITGPRDLSVGAALDEAWTRMSDNASRLAAYGVGPLDVTLGGLFGGQLTALGAVPGGGKTALAAGNVAVHTASRGGRVLFFSLEMPRTDLAWRMAVGACRYPQPIDRINAGVISQEQMIDLQNASQRVASLPVLIEDREVTVNAACALARAEHSRAPLSLIVVDYLHLLQRDVGDERLRGDEVLRRQVYALKGLAKALRIPVLMLVQFNRAGGKSDRPTMFDALGGSAIEQGADNVVILVPDASAAQGPTVRVTAHVDKRRGGPPCREGVALAFDRVRQRFTDVDEFSPAAQSAESSDLEDGAWVE